MPFCVCARDHGTVQTRQSCFSRMYVTNTCGLMKISLVLNACLRPARQGLCGAAASVSRAAVRGSVASLIAFRSSVKFFLGSTLIILLAFNEDLFPPRTSHDGGAGERGGRVLIPVLGQKVPSGSRISFLLVFMCVSQASAWDSLGMTLSSYATQGLLSR